MKIDWKKKLTSRKLWLAVAGLVTGIVMLFTGGGTVEGVVMALGSVVAYIIGEGLVDATSTTTTTSDAESDKETKE